MMAAEDSLEFTATGSHRDRAAFPLMKIQDLTSHLP